MKSLFAHSISRVSLAALLVASASLASVRAEEVDTNDDANKYLGAVYKSEIDRIKIAPPAGSRVMNRAGLDLVSFVNDAKQWGGSVQRVAMKESTTIPQFMTTVADTLNKTFHGLQVLESREVTFEKHKAGRMAMSMQADLRSAIGQKGGTEQVALYRQQLIVQMSDTVFMIVTFYSPLKDQEDATATFNAMVNSFEILEAGTLVQERQAAVEAAKAWLKVRTADELNAKMIHEPQLFRMRVAAKDVGYVRFDESKTSRDGIDGLLISVNSRSYPDENTTLFGQNNAFWAFSKDGSGVDRAPYSTWVNATRKDVPNPSAGKNGGAATASFWIRETGEMQMEGASRFTPEQITSLKKDRERLLRDKAMTPDKIPPEIDTSPAITHLHVSYDGDRTQAFPDGKSAFDWSIDANRPALLPRVLEYTWTRLVDLTKPCEMTFVVYNSAERKLTFRTLSVIGKDHIVIDRKGVDCIRCLDEMDPASTTLWVDATGKVLMMRTSDQSLLLPTTEQAMQDMWGSRAMPR